MKSATEKLVEPSDTMDDSLEGQDAELTSSPIYPGSPAAEPLAHECEWPRFGGPRLVIHEKVAEN